MWLRVAGEVQFCWDTVLLKIKSVPTNLLLLIFLFFHMHYCNPLHYSVDFGFTPDDSFLVETCSVWVGKQQEYFNARLCHDNSQTLKGGHKEDEII